MSRPTVRSKTSSMYENKVRVKAASQRPLEDSSRINACWAWTSRNYWASRDYNARLELKGDKKKSAYRTDDIGIFKSFADKVTANPGNVGILKWVSHQHYGEKDVRARTPERVQPTCLPKIIYLGISNGGYFFLIREYAPRARPCQDLSGPRFEHARGNRQIGLCPA